MKKWKFRNTAVPGWLECVVVLFAAAVILCGILGGAGTFGSGYHFADDHELIRIEKAFRDGAATLGEAVVAHMRGDLHWRYRPLYWAERVTGTWFFGSDLFLWNCYTAVKGTLAFCLLYWMSRYLDYNRVISALVPGVVMLGAQFTPWFRSANQENTGLLLTAFTLCMIAAQAHYRKQGRFSGNKCGAGRVSFWYYDLLIVVGAVLCGLVKESFTLFMPVFIALKIWLEYCDGGKTLPKGHFLRCLKRNLIPCGLIFLAMLANVWMILFRVGVDKVSYAGFDSGTDLWVYKQGVKLSLFQYTKIYTDMGILLLLLAVMCYRAIDRERVKRDVGIVLISGCAMGVQLIAHAKSGMWERYMLPYTVAYVFLFVFALYPLFEKDRVHRMVFYAVLLWLAGNGGKVAYEKSVEYAEDGGNVSQLFGEVCARTGETDEILCAFYDDELNLSLECWLEVHGRPAVYCWTDGAFEDKVQLGGHVPGLIHMEDVDAVLCYGQQREEMLLLLGLEDGKEGGCYQFGNYLLILR